MNFSQIGETLLKKRDKADGSGRVWLVGGWVGVDLHTRITKEVFLKT